MKWQQQDEDYEMIIVIETSYKIHRKLDSSATSSLLGECEQIYQDCILG